MNTALQSHATHYSHTMVGGLGQYTEHTFHQPTNTIPERREPITSIILSGNDVNPIHGVKSLLRPLLTIHWKLMDFQVTKATFASEFSPEQQRAIEERHNISRFWVKVDVDSERSVRVALRTIKSFGGKKIMAQEYRPGPEDICSGEKEEEMEDIDSIDAANLVQSANMEVDTSDNLDDFFDSFSKMAVQDTVPIHFSIAQQVNTASNGNGTALLNFTQEGNSMAIPQDEDQVMSDDAVSVDSEMDDVESASFTAQVQAVSLATDEMEL